MFMSYVKSFVSGVLPLLLCVSVANAYEPPVGIPDPSWGSIHPIDTQAPAHPDGWPSEQVAGFYYIDNTSGSSTDNGNAYGTPDNPRRTIPEGVLAAGSYVEIHGGPYTGGGQIIIDSRGTEAEPVWIRGGDADNLPTIRGETVVKGSYIFLENLFFDTSNKTLGFRGHNGGVVDHAVIRHSRFSGPGDDVGNTSVVGISGLSGNRASDVVVYDNVIHGFGEVNTSSENDYHGVGPHTNVDRVWILENTIYENGGDSVQVGTASTADSNRVSHVYIGGNTFYGDRENAVDVKEANHVVISSNKMYRYRGQTSSSGECVVVHNEPNSVWIMYNEISDCVYGILGSGSSDTHIIGNVIHGVRAFGSSHDSGSAYSGGAAIHLRASSASYMVNNTLYDYEVGIQAASSGPHNIVNNIFMNRVDNDGYDVFNYADHASSQMTNNLFYNESDRPYIRWGSGNQSLTVSGFESTIGSANNLEANPLFAGTDDKSVDAMTDFNLLAGSPAVKKGVSNHYSYDRFFELYGLDIKVDHAGQDRPSIGSWDLGARQLKVAEAPNPPSSISAQQVD